MGACRFMYDNRWLSGTLTFSSENSNFPATNSRHRWFTRTWRSGSHDAEWLRLDRGGVTPVQAFITRFTNFTSGAEVRIQGGPDGATWTAYNELLTPVAEIMVHFMTTEQTHQWWRHYMEDGGKSVAYHEIGLNFLGPYFEPARNYVYGETLDQLDPSLIKTSEGGQLSAVIRDSYWTKVFSFQNITDEEKPDFQAIFDVVGLHKGMFFCDDSDDAQNTTHYVRISKFSWKYVNWHNWTLNLTLEELR